MAFFTWQRWWNEVSRLTRRTRRTTRPGRASGKLSLEQLECRLAPAVSVTQFGAGITANSEPLGITAGADGNLWFTEGSGNRIGRITPAGTVTEFGIGPPANLGLQGITAGPDGNLWFAEYYGPRIGRITPTGTVTEFSAGLSANSGIRYITAGPDGNLWFTEYEGNRIGRITPTGTVTEFGAGLSASSGPWGIAAGPDGNVWFTEKDGSRVGRITPTGTITEFSAGLSAGCWPQGITAGPDGNLWFAESYGNRIGRITPAGTVTEFSAGITANGWPKGITAGPDGNLWFTEAQGTGSGRVGRITPAGTVTEFGPGPSSWPWDITAGPDGNLWFTAYTANQVGRLSGPTHMLVTAPAAQAGTPAAVTVALTSGAGTPTGSVTLSVDGGAPLTQTLSNGSTTFQLTGLAPGAHQLTATYADQPMTFAASAASATLQVGTAIPPRLADPGFEGPSVGTGSGAYKYTPPGSSWTFAGTAGLAGNGSIFTGSNPAAPQGTQVAFLQQTGSVSQAVVFPAAGTYVLSFSAAQRGSNNATYQALQVKVDGSAIGTPAVAGSAYATYTTASFTVSAGSHVIAIAGTNPNGGDNTALIDQVVVYSSGPPVSDPNFSGPSVGTGTNAFKYDPAGSSWTFSGTAGLAGNGSIFTSSNPAAPQGTQVAFLQQTGSVNQTVVFPSAGTYVLSFSAAQRGSSNATYQALQVTVDGTAVGILTPVGSAYATYTTASFTVSAGSHAIAIAATNPNGGDNTALIDQVAVYGSGPQVSDPNFSGPGVGTGGGAYKYDPAGSSWTFVGTAGLAGNGSLFTSGNPAAPQGTQVAFLQQTGSVSQVLGFAAGNYTISFSAAQRGSGNSSSLGQAFAVKVVDSTGTVVSSTTFTPTGTAFVSYTTSAFTVPAGTYTLRFVGLNPNGGDNTALIDQVAVNPVP